MGRHTQEESSMSTQMNELTREQLYGVIEFLLNKIAELEAENSSSSDSTTPVDNG